MKRNAQQSLVPPACLPARSLLLALLAAGLAPFNAEAADIGQARLLSGANEPLRLLVPVLNLSEAEAASLSARAADAAAWQQNGLTPPVALENLQVSIEPGLTANARSVLIKAATAPGSEVVDMLLEVASASGQRRVQVSLLAPRPATDATHIAPARLIPTTVSVRRGDVLSRIALAHKPADATLYQMLAALYQANPAAFILENMNLMRAGATLTVPDAATVRAIDPNAARRLFLAHQEAFFRWRAARAGARGQAGAASAMLTAEHAANLPPTQPDALTRDTPVASGDRLRLSSPTDSTALAEQAGDEATARLRAQHEATQRVAQLEHNVHAMQRALAETNAETSAEMPGSGAAQIEAAHAKNSAPLHHAWPQGVSSAQASTANGSGTVSRAAARASAPARADVSQAGSAAPLAEASHATTPLASTAGSASATAQAVGRPGGTMQAATSASSATGQSAASTAASHMPADNASPDSTSANHTQTDQAQTDSTQTTTGETASAPKGLIDLGKEELIALLVAALGLLALPALWLKRRRALRRASQAHDAALQAQFTRRLEAIDLNLDAPPPAAAATPAATPSPAPGPSSKP